MPNDLIQTGGRAPRPPAPAAGELAETMFRPERPEVDEQVRGELPEPPNKLGVKSDKLISAFTSEHKITSNTDETLGARSIASSLRITRNVE